MKIKINILRWLLDVFPKGIAVFAIAAGAFYAYAATITFPSVDPYPVTGVVGQFIGLSAEGYDDTVTDYQSLNAKCRTGQVVDILGSQMLDNAGAHVCTPMEMINSYNINSSIINAWNIGTGILNTGPPGYTVFANDCDGWSVRTAAYQGSPAFASVWSLAGNSGSLAACDQVFNNANVKVACCR